MPRDGVSIGGTSFGASFGASFAVSLVFLEAPPGLKYFSKPLGAFSLKYNLHSLSKLRIRMLAGLSLLRW